MAKFDTPRNEDGIYEPTEMRQANSKTTNFRVLLGSLTLAVVVGIVLVAGFWQATPTGMDYSSGGKLQQKLPTPSDTNQAAPDASPSQTQKPEGTSP